MSKKRRRRKPEQIVKLSRILPDQPTTPWRGGESHRIARRLS